MICPCVSIKYCFEFSDSYFDGKNLIEDLKVSEPESFPSNEKVMEEIKRASEGVEGHELMKCDYSDCSKVSLADCGM